MLAFSNPLRPKHSPVPEQNTSGIFSIRLFTNQLHAGLPLQPAKKIWWSELARLAVEYVGYKISKWRWDVDGCDGYRSFATTNNEHKQAVWAVKVMGIFPYQTGLMKHHQPKRLCLHLEVNHSKLWYMWCVSWVLLTNHISNQNEVIEQSQQPLCHPFILVGL